MKSTFKQLKPALPDRLDTLTAWFKVLADPSRLRIVNLLMQGEQCNCEMGGKLDMAPNLVSHHLRVLQKAGLVITRRDPVDARWIHYSLDQQTLETLNQEFGAFFDLTRIRRFRPDRCPALSEPVCGKMPGPESSPANFEG